MDIDYKKDKISLKKELNALDALTLEFCSLLNELNIKYVVISGYVAILFGRSRASEDIDIIAEKVSKETFRKLWASAAEKFECINTSVCEDAFSEYLEEGSAIRFSRKGQFIPNVEFKFQKNEVDRWSISSLELQISFKLYLGTEKDIEDAKHLYEVFKDKLNPALIAEFNRKFKVEDAFNRYLK